MTTDQPVTPSSTTSKPEAADLERRASPASQVGAPTTDQPTTPRAALLAFATWLDEHEFPAPLPSSVFAQLAREHAERLPDEVPASMAELLSAFDEGGIAALRALGASVRAGIPGTTPHDIDALIQGAITAIQAGAR